MNSAISSMLFQRGRISVRSRRPIILGFLVLAGVAGLSGAANAAPSPQARVRSRTSAGPSSCASTAGAFTGTGLSFEQADGAPAKEVVVAAIERNPRRKVERWNSLTWLPDVAERLELLEEHGRRAAERQMRDLDASGATTGKSPRLHGLESKEQQR